MAWLCLDVKFFGMEISMSLQTMRAQILANGAVIRAAITAGIGVKTPPPPPPPTGGATDAELDVMEADLKTQDAELQKAIDDAAAAGSGDPVAPGLPGSPKVVSIDAVTIAAGATLPVTIKGTGLTGGSAVGTGGLSFANAVVVDDSTVTVDVTAIGAAGSTQTIGVQVGSVTSNELPLSIT